MNAATNNNVIISLPQIPHSEGDSKPVKIQLQATGQYIYCQVSTKVFAFDVQATEGEWSELPLQGVVDLSLNPLGELSARCREGKEAVFYLLSKLNVRTIAKQEEFLQGSWYVDMVGRVWFQAYDQDQSQRAIKLTILQTNKKPIVFTSRASKYSSRARVPCEYRPGHVVLFLNAKMVWATPDKILLREPPKFAADGTGKSPVRLGDHYLLSGGGNNAGVGSHVIDLRQPKAGARRIRLGWSWQTPIATAPDGRALVQAQTDRNPKFTLFWFSADGKSQTQLVGAEAVLRSGFNTRKSWRLDGAISSSVCFDKRNVGYAKLSEGGLAIFEQEAARIITPRTGLPVEKIVDIALAGNYLAMLGPNGNVVLWDTRRQLPKPAEEEFHQKTQWAVTGPCCIDSKGDLWTFLTDFPDQISRFDGQAWSHREIVLGNRKPQTLTADDRGNLQLSFRSAPEGGDLITPTGIESWHSRMKGWDNDFKRVWKTSLQRGATRFFNGVARRPRHWIKGDRLWLFDGRVLWDGVIEADYYELPPYKRWWVEPDGTWFRQAKSSQTAPLMRYSEGHWQTEPNLPSRHLLGRGGLQAYDWSQLRENYDRYLTVTWSPQGEPIAHASNSFLPENIELGSVTTAVRLKGDELYLADPEGTASESTDDDGGWVGKWRFHKGLFIDLGLPGEVYEGKSGRFLFDQSKGLLSRLPRRELRVEVNVNRTETGWDLTPVVDGLPPEETPRFAITINGKTRPSLITDQILKFDAETHALAEIQLWAVDHAANISSAPAIVKLGHKDIDKEPSEAAPVLPRAQWTVLPNRILISGTEYMPIGRGLAVRGDGLVFVTASSESSRASQLLSYDPEINQWRRIPTTRSQPVGRRKSGSNEIGVAELTRSPGGQIYAVGGGAKNGRLSIQSTRGLYRVGSHGLQLVTNIDVPRTRPLSLTWDAAGGLWNLTLRSAGRFHKGRWTRWELPLGVASITTSPGGQAAILSEGRYWTFIDGRLSGVQTLPEGWTNTSTGTWVGETRLLLKASSHRKGRKVLSWVLLNLEEQTVEVQKMPHFSSVRSDGRGNVFISSRDEPMKKLSGKNFTICTIPLQDVNLRTWLPIVPYGIDFLATQTGVAVWCPSGGGVLSWSPTAGLETHDWRSNIIPANVRSLVEDRDGCVWILTDKQLLRYDPAGNGELDEHPYQGWQEIFTGGLASPGFDQSVWLMTADLKTVEKHNGEVTQSWDVSDALPKGRPSIEIVADTGEAIVRSTSRHTVILSSNGQIGVADDLYSAVATLVQRGAKQFHAPKNAPVVSKNGIIYCQSKVFSNGVWKATHEGQASLDSAGKLILATNLQRRRGLPYFYRWQDGDWQDLGEQERFLLGSSGIRWFEPILLQKEPSRFVIVTREEHNRNRFLLTLSPEQNALGKFLQPDSAMPCGNRRLLVRSQSVPAHCLIGPDLFEEQPKIDVPFGRSRGQVHQLANGRWTWILQKQVFISPPQFTIGSPKDRK